jgi:hypothetical protein
LQHRPRINSGRLIAIEPKVEMGLHDQRPAQHENAPGLSRPNPDDRAKTSILRQPLPLQVELVNGIRIRSAIDCCSATAQCCGVNIVQLSSMTCSASFVSPRGSVPIFAGSGDRWRARGLRLIVRPPVGQFFPRVLIDKDDDDSGLWRSCLARFVHQGGQTGSVAGDPAAASRRKLPRQTDSR